MLLLYFATFYKELRECALTNMLARKTQPHVKTASRNKPKTFSFIWQFKYCTRTLVLCRVNNKCKFS